MNTPEKPKVSIWYLTRYLKKYRLLVVLTFIFLFAGRIFSSFDPIWLKKIIDGIGHGETLKGLSAVIIIYFGLNIARIVSDLLRDIIFTPAEHGIAQTLSEELYAHLVALPLRYHHDQKIGGIARKITRGGRAIGFLLDILVLSIFPTFIELFIVTYLLLRLYSPAYAIITFSTVVIYTIFTIWATEKRQIFRVAANEADDDASSHEVDTLGNIETVKYFTNEAWQIKGYKPITTRRFKLNVSSNNLFSVITSGQSLILLLGVGSILMLAIRQSIAGMLTIGDLVLLTTYVVRISSPISVLGFIYRQLKDGYTDLEGMANILHEEISIVEPENPISVKNPKGEIVLNDVSFSYNANRSIMEHISLTVKPGQRIAFVGPSGVGKSTIVKLLFRLYEPTSGTILVDGVPLDQISTKDRGNIFSIVPQEPALFNTSIGENIRFGKPGATQEEVERAAKLASIDGLIAKLPDGYETEVGERGVKLSGGEKQRVAIARAIIRDPKVLVFDEATSSLDSNSEAAIQDALAAVSQGRTTIAVAHRLSTISNSDQIYVLSDKGIAEQGTHTELLAMNGLYAQLWKTQAKQKDAK